MGTLESEPQSTVALACRARARMLLHRRRGGARVQSRIQHKITYKSCKGGGERTYESIVPV